MSSLFVHVGQCGNQVALPFWQLAESEVGISWPSSSQSSGAGAPSIDHHPLFADTQSGRCYARCLMVDSEPKVVTSTARSMRTVRPENVCLDHSGRGNNWAMGFMSCAAEEEHQHQGAAQQQQFGKGGTNTGVGLFTQATEAIRREAERTDALRSFIMVHSLGGGTGSGAGSALLQHLRDYYPACWLLPVAVGPFARGDTPLQSYNELFSLQYLQEFSDGVLYTDNDELCRSILQTKSGSEEGARALTSSPSNYPQMNQALAHDLAAALFPLRQLQASNEEETKDHDRRGDAVTPSFSASARTWRAVDVGQLVAATVPLRSLRFLEVRSSLAFADVVGPAAVRRRRFQGGGGIGGATVKPWADLTRATARTAPTRDTEHRPITTIAAHVTLRGVGNTTKKSSDLRRDIVKEPAVSHYGPAGAAALKDAEEALRKQLFGASRSGGRSSSASLGTDCGLGGFGLTHPGVSGDCGHGRLAFVGPHVAQTAAVITNRTHIAARLRSVLSSAAKKFLARAYVHWYAEHGLEVDDFAAAFTAVGDVVESYDAFVAAAGRRDD